MKIPDTVKTDILRRLQTDQEYAKSVQNAHTYDTFMRQIHEDNAAYVRKLVNTYSLSALLNESSEVAEAVFILIQHAISMPDFLKSMLELLQEVTPSQPIYVAYMTDRIMSMTRRPQVYGCSYDYDESGQMVMYWVTDSKDVINERRLAIGLSTVEENEQRFIHRPPMTLEAAREYLDRQHQWLIETGWCTEAAIKQYNERNR